MFYFLGHLWRKSEEMEVYSSCVVVPREKSIVHLQSWKAQGANKQMPRESINEELAAAHFSNRHVYLVCGSQWLDAINFKDV